MNNGAVAQHAMCTYVWVEKNECKICGGPGIEKRRYYHCKWWTNPRLQMSAEVSAFEHIAKDDDICWLWETGIASFTGSMQTERAVDCEQASCSESQRMSKDSEKWNRDPGRTEEE